VDSHFCEHHHAVPEAHCLSATMLAYSHSALSLRLSFAVALGLTCLSDTISSNAMLSAILCDGSEFAINCCILAGFKMVNSTSFNMGGEVVMEVLLSGG